MTPVHPVRSLRRRAFMAISVAMLVLPAFALNSPVSAATTPAASCADAVTTAPAGRATVSVANNATFGSILVIGSGAYRGCSLYLLTSDKLHQLAGAPFACGDGPNPIGLACDTALWPALLTKGAPIAGPGVNPGLLGTVTRTDLPGLPAVRQVTYAGFPLYRFFLDEAAGETDGANLFDPVTSPTGIWYLVDPHRGRPAPGRAHLQLETAPVGGTGPNAKVLAVTMDHGFALAPDASFPVYTLSRDRRSSGRSTCSGFCSAVYWPPVLTSGRPLAGPGVSQAALGTILRSDGSHQVTYRGKPLYLYSGDAYIPTLPYGPARIDGAGLRTRWGVFNTIPRLAG
jgi:predicted lipoprotein with Yx(FWY)xxD motif